jgi:hypothetical protein
VTDLDRFVDLLAGVFAPDLPWTRERVRAILEELAREAAQSAIADMLRGVPYDICPPVRPAHAWWCSSVHRAATCDCPAKELAR